jgi:mRNA-degrading endonuclease RelE of RelBE toxin-antitoxin system
LSAKDEDVPKPKQEDVDDEQVEEKPKQKPQKKTYPPRYTEKGLWRVHNAVYRVSFVF